LVCALRGTAPTKAEDRVSCPRMASAGRSTAPPRLPLPSRVYHSQSSVLRSDLQPRRRGSDRWRCREHETPAATRIRGGSNKANPWHRQGPSQHKGKTGSVTTRSSKTPLIQLTPSSELPDRRQAINVVRTDLRPPPRPVTLRGVASSGERGALAAMGLLQIVIGRRTYRAGRIRRAARVELGRSDEVLDVLKREIESVKGRYAHNGCSPPRELGAAADAPDHRSRVDRRRTAHGLTN
jgi:hypothetical protein